MPTVSKASTVMPAKVYCTERPSGATSAATTCPWLRNKSSVPTDAGPTSSFRFTVNVVKGISTKEPSGGSVETTPIGTSSYQKPALQAHRGLPSSRRVKTPSAMAIVCGPWLTMGLVSKWNARVSGSTCTKSSAGIPLTVKSVASTVSGS